MHIQATARLELSSNKALTRFAIRRARAASDFQDFEEPLKGEISPPATEQHAERRWSLSDDGCHLIFDVPPIFAPPSRKSIHLRLIFNAVEVEDMIAKLGELRALMKPAA